MDKIHTAGDFLAELERRWLDEKYYPAVIEAFEWCAGNFLPLPDWLAQAIRGALQLTLARGGRDGNDRKGGFLPQARQIEKHEVRWSLAKHWLVHRDTLPSLGFAATRDGAFAFASELLRGTSAQGSADRVEASYDLIERKRRTHPA